MLFPHFTWSIHFVLFLSYFSTVEHFSLALKRFYSPLVRSYRVLGRNYVKFSRFSALALSSRVADVLPSPTAFLISVNFFVRIWPLGVFFPRPIARALSAVHFLSDWYCRRFGRSGTEGGGGGRGAPLVSFSFFFFFLFLNISMQPNAFVRSNLARFSNRNKHRYFFPCQKLMRPWLVLT